MAPLIFLVALLADFQQTLRIRVVVGRTLGNGNRRAIPLEQDPLRDGRGETEVVRWTYVKTAQLAKIGQPFAFGLRRSRRSNGAQIHDVRPAGAIRRRRMVPYDSELQQLTAIWQGCCTTMSNVLDPRDQIIFDLEQATGATSLLHCAWIYNCSIDVDRFRQFYERLKRGPLSRRIERSVLPFGRHRWISPDGASDLEIVTSARPREEFEAWLSEQAHIPLDPERGPGWHLAAQPFTDSGTGISLVISHCLTDGVGLCQALADAVLGCADSISWPAASSRRRWQAFREDARQTVRDIPALGRAFIAAVRLARRSRGVARAAIPLLTMSTGLLAVADEPVSLPMATIFIDAEEWDARAHSLGGTSNTLLVGLAALLAQRIGRVTADGSVVVRMPVNERTAGDTRANANSNVEITVDPVPVTTDLREIRAAIKQALIRTREVPDEERAMFSLIPLLPQRFVRLAPAVVAGVISSNLGVINPAVRRPAGTEADWFAMKLHYLGMTPALLHRFGGLQMVAAGRSNTYIFISVVAYQPGRSNTNDQLRQDLVSALSDFSLTSMHF